MSTKYSLLALTLSAVFAAACTTGSAVPPGETARDDDQLFPEGTLTVIVRAPGGEPLADVKVSAINSLGIQDLGKTDSGGAFTLETEVLRAKGPFALLFCHRDFPCGATVADDTLYRYRELHIRLAEAVFY